MSSVDKKLESIKERLRIYPPYSNRQYIRPLSFAEFQIPFCWKNLSERTIDRSERLF